MKTEREILQESSDFWAESAKHDKRQFLASFAIAASGLVLLADGVRNIVRGNLEGLWEVGIGETLWGAFYMLGMSEIDDFADSTARVAVRQYEVDRLPEDTI